MSLIKTFVEVDTEQLLFQDWILEKNKVDVWFKKNHIHLFDKDKYLSQADINQANQFYFKKDKELFLHQHVWINKILHLYLPHIRPQELIFTKNSYGKPQLNGVEFNLSHAGEWTVLAVTCENSVGIDIEKFCQLDYVNLAKSVFSVREVNQLKQLKTIKQAYAFFQLWSQKEAFIKAIGKGLSYSTSSFDVDWKVNCPNKIIDLETGQNWLISRFLVQIGYAGAVCYQENINQINFFKLI